VRGRARDLMRLAMTRAVWKRRRAALGRDDKTLLHEDARPEIAGFSGRALQGGSAGEDDVGPSTDPDLVGLGGDVDAPASSHCGALRGDVGR
jgi:hypothetical protein